MKFKVSSADPGFFIKEEDSSTVWILVYVDDILVAAKNLSEVEHFIRTFLTKFEARDLGDASFFLGMEITRDLTQETIKLTQVKYANEVVSRFGMKDCNPTVTSSSTSVKLTKDGDVLDMQRYPYREAVGALLYLAMCTRPDIAQAVGAVARYMSTPSTKHWSAVKMIVRYIKGTAKMGLLFGRGKSGMLGYCDADYAGDVDTRRSNTGYVFVLNGAAVSYSSQLQPTVAASTVEAEYMAASRAVKEALWLRKLLPELDIGATPMTIYGDNQGALKLLKNPITSVRSKHIDVHHHLTREQVCRGEVEFRYISTDDMVADILTMALPRDKVKKCREDMGIC
jgi:ribonuclease HI